MCVLSIHSTELTDETLSHRNIHTQVPSTVLHSGLCFLCFFPIAMKLKSAWALLTGVSSSVSNTKRHLLSGSVTDIGRCISG